uniref:glucuronosyltransferase n=1 Tax=Meloidogyne hapla TaxID=6305 RepID=A0A1I8AWI6_MELHA
MNAGTVKTMFDIFEQYKSYQFIVRMGGFVPQEYNEEIIKVQHNPIDQQKILTEQDTILFITHCGQNSLNEVFIEKLKKVSKPEDQIIVNRLPDDLLADLCDLLGTIFWAMYAGVPMICIPPKEIGYNASLVEHLEIGIFVQIYDKNNDYVFKVSFEKALKKILKKRYKENL